MFNALFRKKRAQQMIGRHIRQWGWGDLTEMSVDSAGGTTGVTYEAPPRALFTADAAAVIVQRGETLNISSVEVLGWRADLHASMWEVENIWRIYAIPGAPTLASQPGAYWGLGCGQFLLSGIIGVINCSTTNGSTTLTRASGSFSTSGVLPNQYMYVFGVGIPVGAYITAVGTTTCTMSQAANATSIAATTCTTGITVDTSLRVTRSAGSFIADNVVAGLSIAGTGIPSNTYVVAVVAAGTQCTNGATHGTTTLTRPSGSFLGDGVQIGSYISGTDIPANAYVVAVPDALTLTISAAATGTHSSLTFTFGEVLTLSAAATADGTGITFTFPGVFVYFGPKTVNQNHVGLRWDPYETYPGAGAPGCWQAVINYKAGSAGHRAFIRNLPDGAGGSHVVGALTSMELCIEYYPGSHIKFRLSGGEATTIRDGDADLGGDAPLAGLVAHARDSSATLVGVNAFVSTGPIGGTLPIYFWPPYADTQAYSGLEPIG